MTGQPEFPAVDPNAIVPFFSFALAPVAFPIMAWAQHESIPTADPAPPPVDPDLLLAIVGHFTGLEQLPEFRSALAAGDATAAQALAAAVATARQFLPPARERCQKLFADGEWRVLYEDARVTADLAQALGEDELAAWAYIAAARSAWRLDEYEDAITFYRWAIAAANRHEPPLRNYLSACHDNLAKALQATERLDQAAEQFTLAYSYAADDAERCAVSENLGGLYQQLGEYARAAQLFQEVYDTRTALHTSDLGRAIALDDLGLALFDNGDAESAIELYEQARKLIPGNEIQHHLINTRMRCSINAFLERTDEAAAAFDEGWSLAQQIAGRVDEDHYRRGLSDALTHATTDDTIAIFEQARLASAARQWDQAIGMFQRVAEKAQGHRNRLLYLRCYANIAAELAEEQRIDDAMRICTQVRQAGLREGLAQPVVFVAGTMASMAISGADAAGDVLPLAAEGLALAEMHNRLVAALVVDPAARQWQIVDAGLLLMTVAKAALRGRAYVTAAQLSTRAIECARTSGYRFGEVNRSIDLLQALDALPGRETDAEFLAQWLRSAAADPALSPLARLGVLRHLGVRGLGVEQAVTDLRAAAGLLEQLRASRPPGQARGDLDREYGVYQSLAPRLRAAAAPADEQFGVLQGGRARHLMEILTAATGDVDPYRPPVVAEIQALLGRQLRPTAFVDIVAAADGLHAFLVDGRGLQLIEIAGDIAPLERLRWGDVRRRSADALEAMRSPIAVALSTAVSAAVADGTSLLISVDDALANLPLHAIPVDGQLWGERLSIGRVPAAGVLRFTPAQRTASGRSLVAGDSHDDLQGARAECLAVGRLLAARPLVGAACTFDAIAGELKGQALDIVHLAVHGRADARFGGRSSLLFAGPDSPNWVQFDQLAALPWTADLIVFSGCSTAVGGPRNGAGLYGIAQAAAQAGARTVVASLWPVNDHYAAEFMQAFYAGIDERRSAGAPSVDLREVVDEARAHVKALLATSTVSAVARDGRELIIAKAEPEEPSDMLVHWAPFVVLGDPVVPLSATT
jgi:tetratricopeptide (TPR) repeat protein